MLLLLAVQHEVWRRGGSMTYEQEIRDAIARGEFRYLRCACRLHKCLPYYIVPRGGYCGACGQECVEATDA